MTARQALGWYRAVYVGAIVAASALTAAGASGPRDHLFWLAATEIVAALLLMSRRTSRVALAVLLLVFAFATVHTIAAGEAPPIRFLIYAASAALIVVMEERLPAEEPRRS